MQKLQKKIYFKGEKLIDICQKWCWWICTPLTMHAPPTNYLNLRIKAETVTVEADAMKYNSVHTVLVPACPISGPDKCRTYTYRCIRSISCDTLGFYAEIQIIFGTVCTSILLYNTYWAIAQLGLLYTDRPRINITFI